LAADEGARRTFLIGESRAPRAGEWFRNPDIADTFRRVATDGPSVLYGGSLGQESVDHVQRLGGFITIADLADHEARWVEPMSVSYGSYRLWELPPNGQGIAALEILRILEPYDLARMGHNSAAYLHHLIEATKIAFADLREYVADPDHMRIDPENLLDDEFVDARRALIDPDKALDRPGPGAAVTASETIYLSVADGDGNMISLINSVFEAFGSRVVVPGTGFVMQDRGAGFTLQADHANTVAPRKLPFHTLIPAFVTRDIGNGDEPWLSYGVMGGSMQPQGHVQMLLNLIEFDMDLQDAIDAARYRIMGGVRVAIEPPVGDDVRARLEAMGHDVLGAADYEETAREFVWRFGGAQAVMRLPRGWAAGSDPRKDGMAAGN
jgi:gamma-glutamyltranspeptidase/glutathione hydrolase